MFTPNEKKMKNRSWNSIFNIFSGSLAHCMKLRLLNCNPIQPNFGRYFSCQTVKTYVQQLFTFFNSPKKFWKPEKNVETMNTFLNFVQVYTYINPYKLTLGFGIESSSFQYDMNVIQHAMPLKSKKNSLAIDLVARNVCFYAIFNLYSHSALAEEWS